MFLPPADEEVEIDDGAAREGDFARGGEEGEGELGVFGEGGDGGEGGGGAGGQGEDGGGGRGGGGELGGEGGGGRGDVAEEKALGSGMEGGRWEGSRDRGGGEPRVGDAGDVPVFVNLGDEVRHGDEGLLRTVEQPPREAVAPARKK